MYEKDVEAFTKILNDYKMLKEDDGITAYNLMKKSLVLYDRFSYIKSDLSKTLERGNPIKKRLSEICDILMNIHVGTRQIYQNVKAEKMVSR